MNLEFKQRTKMKKSEILQIALVVLGVFIIIRTFETFAFQINMIATLDDGYGSMGYWIFAYIGIIVIMTLIGFLLIRKSGYFSKKLIKIENDDDKILKISRNEIVSISIIIMCLHFMITGFTGFAGAITTLITSFFTDFSEFKEILPGQTWYLLQYILVIILFINSEKFSNWIVRKIMK